MLNAPSSLFRVLPVMKLLGPSGPAARYWERRRRGRGMKVCWAGLLRLGDVTHSCLVRNISANGMMIEIDIIVRPGTRAEMIVYGYGAIPATVRWYNQGRIGLEFDMPIMMDRILRARDEMHVPARRSTVDVLL